MISFSDAINVIKANNPKYPDIDLSGQPLSPKQIQELVAAFCGNPDPNNFWPRNTSVTSS